jgi:hypothetical protein
VAFVHPAVSGVLMACVCVAPSVPHRVLIVHGVFVRRVRGRGLQQLAGAVTGIMRGVIGMFRDGHLSVVVVVRVTGVVVCLGWRVLHRLPFPLNPIFHR